MGAAWEVDMEGGVRARRLGNVLLRCSSGVAVFWGRYVGAISANGAKIRGSAPWFPEAGNKVKVKAAEVRVVAEGRGTKSTSGSKDTAALDLLGQDTGDNGGVGGPTAYFLTFFKGDRILGRGKTPGAVMDTNGIRETAEG